MPTAESDHKLPDIKPSKPKVSAQQIFTADNGESKLSLKAPKLS